MTRILLIDNYDSFTYNIAQELGELGADVTVTRHDAFVLEDVATDRPDGIVISPGPGTPDDAGLSMDVIRRFAGDIPILGVLFQRRRVRDERNELLIFLTPRIVNRAESLRR